MRTVQTSVTGKSLLLLLVLYWPAAALAAQCNNPIEVLGGSTAIWRGSDIVTVADLQEVVVNPKFRLAYQQILDKIGLGDRYEEVMQIIGGLTQDKLRSIERGTQFEWMAYRRKHDKRIGLLHNACWEGKENTQGWYFTLAVGKASQLFVIPASCLNLSLLKESPEPPTCTLTATAECSRDSTPTKITVTATGEPRGGATIKGVKLYGDLPDKLPNPTQDKNSFVWSFSAKYPKTNSFTAEVTDSNDLTSEECSAQVMVCEKEVKVYPCKPPSCKLSATVKDESLSISIAGSDGDSFVLTLDKKEILKSDDPGDWSQSIDVPISSEIDYRVELTTARNNCATAVCSTTVRLPSPSPVECCKSDYFVRAFGAYGDSMGSLYSGYYLKAGEVLGPYRFQFGDGLGFGVELERLITKGQDSWKDSAWGGTVGLTRIDLNTKWRYTSPVYRLADEDRIPMLALTVGVNYHLRRPSWDLFGGPVIGYARFDDGSYADGSASPGTYHAEFDDNFVYGAKLGFDAFLRGGCWGLTGGVEYLKVSTKGGFLDVDVDPLILKAGFVYHF